MSHLSENDHFVQNCQPTLKKLEYAKVEIGIAVKSISCTIEPNLLADKLDFFLEDSKEYLKHSFSFLEEN